MEDKVLNSQRVTGAQCQTANYSTTGPDIGDRSQAPAAGAPMRSISQESKEHMVLVELLAINCSDKGGDNPAGEVLDQVQSLDNLTLTILALGHASLAGGLSGRMTPRNAFD
ncbi:hypothetical protein Btru_063935 [Bulinus truncatus]|nr:hypothetical protein Btru_063935 [Bulinus truncatus]